MTNRQPMHWSCQDVWQQVSCCIAGSNGREIRLPDLGMKSSRVAVQPDASSKRELLLFADDVDSVPFHVH